MQQEQEKYDPVILNLSKNQSMTQPKSYLWLFVGSILLLGVLLFSSAGYVLFYAGKPETETSGEGPGPSGQATVAVAEPTPLPSATPTPQATMTPTPQATMTPIPKATAANVISATASPDEKILTGYVSLNSIPEQADVVIDGELLGQTPLNAYELEVGDYSVTFEFDGQRFTREFSITAGETTEYTHRFEGLGSLHITTTSSGCDVYLNGNLLDRKSPVLVEGLPPGDYTILLKKIGYRSTEKQIVLRKGEHRELFLTLRRLGSRSSSGADDEAGRGLHPSERLRN